MQQKLNNSLLIEQCSDDRDDLDALLHPAQAFEHPSDVVNDPDLTLNEKRAILASWASDACAIEAAPTLRCIPGRKEPVRFDDVMDALRALDRKAREQGNRSSPHSATTKRPVPERNDPDREQGHSLN
jgi:hypothetical protein